MVQDLRHCRWPMQASGRPHKLPGTEPMANTDGVLTSFAEKIIKAMKGEKGIVEPTFVYLPGVSGGEAVQKEVGVDYFSVPVELGVRSYPLTARLVRLM
jgi:hypothetical protein